MKIFFPSLSFIVAGIMLLQCTPDKAPVFELKSEESIVEGTPVYIPLSEPYKGQSFHSVENLSSGSIIPAQSMDDAQLIFLLEETLAPNQARKYRLLDDSTPPPWRLAPVQLVENQEGIVISIGQQPVLQYHKSIKYPPAGQPEYYRRSGFIHPLYSPGGQILTDDFPVGHTHQHGLFNAWVNTTFQGDKTDFWNQHQNTGTVRHVKVVKTESGPVFARFTAELEHVKAKDGDTIPALREELTVTVYHREGPFLLDIHSSQHCAGPDTLFLNEYHYGGMALRGSKEWNEEDTTAQVHSMAVITNEGLERDSANHSRPYWINASGPVGGQTAGVTVMGHPDNFRFPQPVRVHPQMPYLVFTPMVLGEFTIVPGQVYTSSYRYLVHNGKPDIVLNEAVWRGYKGRVEVAFSKTN